MNVATRFLFLACLVLAGPPRPAAAQETAPAPPSFEELQATIARMQKQLDGLGAAASAREEALRFLEQQVDAAAGQITGTGQTNEALRGEAAALSTRMEELGRDREQLSRTAGEHAATVDRLTAELAEARRALEEAHRLLSAAEIRIDQQQDTIDALDERLAGGACACVRPR
jgi:chromosome segregation ATPase